MWNKNPCFTWSGLFGAVAEALYDWDDGDAEEEGHEAANLCQELDPVLGEVGDYLAYKVRYLTTTGIISEKY